MQCLSASVQRWQNDFLLPSTTFSFVFSLYFYPPSASPPLIILLSLSHSQDDSKNDSLVQYRFSSPLL